MSNYKRLFLNHFNPIKHNLVKSLKDYKFSTFNKFVRIGLYDENWCNYDDKNKIANLDFE